MNNFLNNVRFYSMCKEDGLSYGFLGSGIGFANEDWIISGPISGQKAGLRIRIHYLWFASHLTLTPGPGSFNSIEYGSLRIRIRHPCLKVQKTRKNP